jgi:hypothetical protein
MTNQTNSVENKSPLTELCIFCSEKNENHAVQGKSICKCCIEEIKQL